MKGRLGAIVEIGITERLLSKTVAPAEFGSVVLKETYIHAEVRLVTGTGHHLSNRYQLPWPERPIASWSLYAAATQKAQRRPIHCVAVRRRALGRHVDKETIRQQRVHPNSSKKMVNGGFLLNTPQQALWRWRVMRDRVNRPGLNPRQGPRDAHSFCPNKVGKWLRHHPLFQQLGLLAYQRPNQARVIRPAPDSRMKQGGRCEKRH